MGTEEDNVTFCSFCRSGLSFGHDCPDEVIRELKEELAEVRRIAAQEAPPQVPFRATETTDAVAALWGRWQAATSRLERVTGLGDVRPIPATPEEGRVREVGRLYTLLYEIGEALGAREGENLLHAAKRVRAAVHDALGSTKKPTAPEASPTPAPPASERSP